MKSGKYSKEFLIKSVMHSSWMPQPYIGHPFLRVFHLSFFLFRCVPHSHLVPYRSLAPSLARHIQLINYMPQIIYGKIFDKLKSPGGRVKTVLPKGFAHLIIAKRRNLWIIHSIPRAICFALTFISLSYFVAFHLSMSLHQLPFLFTPLYLY